MSESRARPEFPATPRMTEEAARNKSSTFSPNGGVRDGPRGAVSKLLREPNPANDSPQHKDTRRPKKRVVGVFFLEAHLSACAETGDKGEGIRKMDAQPK